MRRDQEDAIAQPIEDAVATDETTFTVVITGDLSFGENYLQHEEAKGRENVLKTRGYAYCMRRVAPLLRSASLVIANLETVVTDMNVSPFLNKKRWLHWSDITETPQQLLAHNIHAVSLANNHSIDYGVGGLRQTLDVLSAAGLSAFGAGETLDAARRPLRHEIKPPQAYPARRIELRVFSAFVRDETYELAFGAYARADRAGANPMDLATLCGDVDRAKQATSPTFVVTLLHWLRDYQWRSHRQVEAAKQLIDAGCDLVIGHGSHMLQEIEKVSGRWVVHGVGNFVFNSPGRYAAKKAPPYSLVARLEFSGGQRPTSMQLYPLFTDNRVTRYQTRFVSEQEFREVRALLMKRAPQPRDFAAEIGSGADTFGPYLHIPID